MFFPGQEKVLSASERYSSVHLRPGRTLPGPRGLNEPRSEKTGLRGLRPGPTQPGLYSHKTWLET